MLRGARVVAIVGKGKEVHLQELGVDASIVRGEKDYSGAIHSQLGVSTVDVIADVVAGDQVSNLIETLRIGGRYVTAGAIAGPQVTVDWRNIYLKHLTIFGASLGTQQEAKDIVTYIAQGKLKPLLASTYPLDQLVQAQKDFKKKAFFGKLVIVP